MKLFHKYESCYIISLPAFGNYKIEFVFAPPGYSIQEHTHNNQDIKLVFLFGNNIRFHRRKRGEFLWESFFAKFRDVGHIFTINSGDEHNFEVSNWPLVFMNIEKWHTTPTSASVDLQLTQTI